MTAWADSEDAAVYWADAPVSADLLDRLLESAQEVCEVYAPALAEDQLVPERYTHAVVLQAREHYEAGRRDGDVLGFEDTGYAIRVRPLSNTVKSLLRPRRALGKVG